MEVDKSAVEAMRDSVSCVAGNRWHLGAIIWEMLFLPEHRERCLPLGSQVSIGSVGIDTAKRGPVPAVASLFPATREVTPAPTVSVGVPYLMTPGSGEGLLCQLREFPAMTSDLVGIMPVIVPVPLTA